MKVRPSPFYFSFSLFHFLFVLTVFIHCFIGVDRPSLSKFSRDHVHKARLHVDRSFHSLVTLRRLTKRGLGPEPSNEAIAHKVIVRRSEFLLAIRIYYVAHFISFYSILFIVVTVNCFRNVNNEGKERKRSCG